MAVSGNGGYFVGAGTRGPQDHGLPAVNLGPGVLAPLAQKRCIADRVRAGRGFLLSVLGSLVLAACAGSISGPAPESPPEVRPEPSQPASTRPEPRSSPAVLELSDQARAALEAGQPVTAGALLERAIRIEPRNGALWHELARVRFEQGNYEQARQLANRSNALLASSSALKVRNDALIDAARDAASY